MTGALSTLNREKIVARTFRFVEIIYIFIIQIFIENTFQFQTLQIDYIADRIHSNSKLYKLTSLLFN